MQSVKGRIAYRFMTKDLAANDKTFKDRAPKQERAKRRKEKRPADQWLAAVLLPHASTLSRKAWLDVASGLMAIPIAFSLAFGIDALVADKSGLSGLFPYALALFASIGLRALLAYLAGRLGHHVSSAVRRDLRGLLALRLANHPPLDKERKAAGEVAALGSDVIEALNDYTARYLSLKRQLIVIPLMILIASASISWAAALILMVCGPLVPVFMAIVGIRAKKASDDQISALSDMSSLFLDRLSGMTTLKLFRAVGRTREEFDILATDYRKATMRVLRIAFLSSAALELFAALGIALTAIFAAYHYLGSIDYGTYGAPITLGTGLFLLLLAPEFFSPLREFAVAYHDKATAQAAADRLMQVLPIDWITAQRSEMETALVPSSTASAPITIDSVVFKSANLGYLEDAPAVLKDVSFRFEKGEKIAILGASGSGKSTILGALCGFLSPLAGNLEINHQALDAEQWAALRPTIGWIGQRPHIFHGSVLMNVRLAAPKADRDAVRQALEHAHGDHFVTQLPRDLLTILGETGFGISGGQVRRLAIARAMLSDASLILCDEPTADLDAETASLVTDSLMQIAEGRLLVVATHDRSVAECCDRILYVHDGRVQAISHAELAALDEAALAERTADSPLHTKEDAS
ncbi:thiol reductant ABC exporter subunit CydD [Cohaesibacter sp. CAU 1516]|nr:thiol reductant ABC exporter subunit CydD [Cohaesibacter sp. CAU 1516]